MRMVDSFEKIPVKIFHSLEEGSRCNGKEIGTLMREKEEKGEKTVLGLATGSSPKSLYAELVRLHREEKLSFKNVVTFNLDEYYPIDNDALQSYNRFMKEQLFSKVDIDPANCHIPNGQWKKEDIKQHCLEYEQMIEQAGGNDLQKLHHGKHRQNGFNQPRTRILSPTPLLPLANCDPPSKSHAL